MCVTGEKSRLLIIGTKELKRNRIGDQCISITEDDSFILDVWDSPSLTHGRFNRKIWSRRERGCVWDTLSLAHVSRNLDLEDSTDLVQKGLIGRCWHSPSLATLAASYRSKRGDLGSVDQFSM